MIFAFLAAMLLCLLASVVLAVATTLIFRKVLDFRGVGPPRLVIRTESKLQFISAGQNPGQSLLYERPRIPISHFVFGYSMIA